MSVFTTDRERRLWLWALVVLVAIFSTLGPAQTLVEAIRARNLLRLSLALVLFPVAAVLVWRWVKRRPGGREIGVGIGVAAAYLMAWFRVESPEERTHLFEYGVVAVLIHRALLERQQHGRRVRAPAVLAAAVTMLLGGLDEGIQAILPNRVYDIRDVGFNVLAVLMAIASRLALAWARRKRQRQRQGHRV